jgi:Spy/CpxP family protein refolding chaperone
MKSIFKYSPAHRTLILAGILAASCGALVAQNDSPPEGPPPNAMRGRGPNMERQLQMLTERLSLTADQQTQVKAVLIEQRQKMQELRKSSAGTDASAQGGPPDRTQMEAIRNDSDTKITALLNDDQKTKYAAMLQERKDRMARRGGGGDGPPPPPNQ